MRTCLVHGLSVLSRMPRSSRRGAKRCASSTFARNALHSAVAASAADCAATRAPTSRGPMVVHKGLSHEVGRAS